MTELYSPSPTGNHIVDANLYQLLRLLRGDTLYVDEILRRVGIGTNAPAAEAALDVVSTTAVFVPPRMTTTQRDALSAPPAGGVIFNTTLAKHQGWDGSAWNNLY